MQSLGTCYSEGLGKHTDAAIARLRSTQLRSKLLARSRTDVDSQTSAPLPAVVPVLLPKNQLQALFCAIHQGLQLESLDVAVKLILMGASDMLEQSSSKELSLEDWARFSLQLDLLCARLDQLPLPLQEGIAPSHFARLNLYNLAKVCRYIWTHRAKETLVAIFAVEQADKCVSNPALAQSQLNTISAELSASLPLLKARLEFNQQQLESIDDDGNFVTTSLTGCNVTGKASAAVISGKAKLGGALGHCSYTKNWQDYARLHFTKLWSEHQSRPELAGYLSRAACLGGSKQLGDEIAAFDQLEAYYVLQQRSNSRQFSLLVSSQSAHQSARQSTLPASDSRPCIALGVAPCPIIKQAEGIITTLGGAASASLGMDLSVASLALGAEVTGQTKTIRYRSLETLCEVLNNAMVDPSFKVTMVSKLTKLTTMLRDRLDQFWGQPEPLTVAQQIKRLRADVGHYFRLHAWQQAGHADVRASITAFHAAYAAQNTDECLRNIAWMAAFLYSELMQQNTSPSPNITQLKEQLLAIEASLHRPSIAHTKGYLTQRAAASQKIKQSSNEVAVQFSVAADGGWGPVNLNGSVKFTYSRQERTNALVAGDKVQVEVTLGPNLALNQQLLTLVNDYFLQNLGLPVPAEMIDFFDGIELSGQLCSSWQFLKATAIGTDLPFVQLYQRQTVQLSAATSLISLPIPIAGLGTLRLATSQSATHKKLLRETPGSGTILYYARYFMNARSSDKMDQHGRIMQRCYWQELERKHQAALARLFLQYAKNSRDQGYLMRELAAIRKKFLVQADEAQLLAWDIARAEFLVMAQQFALDPCSDNYQATLQGFKNLLHVWYPHWKNNKDRDGIAKCRTRHYHLG